MTLVARKPAESRFAKVLVHSVAGNGKTRFLGSAQEDERTYPMALLNFEGGEGSLAGLDIDVYDIHDKADYDDAFLMLSDKSCKYKSVGVDSVTETQVTGLLAILDNPGPSGRADPDQLAQPDWGVSLIQMRRVCRQFYKSLRMHVFMTALSKQESVARVGMRMTPALQGAFASELPGIPDVLAYLALTEDENGDEERTLLLHGYPKFHTKVRTPWGVEVPEEIVDPTVAKLLDVLAIK